MPVPIEYSNRFAYHFTTLHNLESVIEHGILSTNRKIASGLPHFNVAEQGIQNRRHEMIIPAAGGRGVHDYVPFYFAKRTPMLLSVINKKNVDQQFVVYFAIPVNILNSNAGAVFTDASANTDTPPNFYTAYQSEYLANLSWATIDNAKWSYPDDNERHKKMAELLVPDVVQVGQIAHIVVWNQGIERVVRESFASKGVPCPPVFCESRHYYCEAGNWNQSLITGPYWLKKNVEDAVDYVINFNRQSQLPKFGNLQEALSAVKADFCSIREIADIDGLGAEYGPHSDDVGTHSRKVAENVVRSPEYANLGDEDKVILEMAAYLHDIGKGPKSRWSNACMDRADNNHANRSISMLTRILTEDVGSLSREVVRKLIMLVVYDDLLGDIAAKGRDKQQLFDIITCPCDINMLVALSKADIESINIGWWWQVGQNIEHLRNETLNNLNGVAG